MSLLTLDSDLLTQLISSNGSGSIDTLRKRWAEFYSDESTVPDRATLYRWRDGKLPRNKKRFLQLCGLIDADPFAILSLPVGNEANAIQLLYRSFWLNQWRQQALSFLSEFFGHHADWPPNQIAKDYFRRSWVTHEFEHAADRGINFYGSIQIVGDRSLRQKDRPQIFHFAYSQPGIFAHRWIQYGYIKLQKKKVTLINITGDIQQYTLSKSNSPINVETWFGPTPTKFKISSLHSFSVLISDQTYFEKECVRFSA